MNSVGQYSGFDEESRDPPPSGREVVPQYDMQGGGFGAREGPVVEGRRSIGAFGKDMMRTFQTTIQRNGRSQQMMPENSTAPASIQPSLQRMASESSRIVTSMQQSAIVGSVSSGLSSVNDKLGEIRRASVSTFSMNSSERGIYSSESATSWGRTVSAEISTFATQKVKPMFRRSNTCPSGVVGIGGIGPSKVHDNKVVSFDYILMKDNE